MFLLKLFKSCQKYKTGRIRVGGRVVKAIIADSFIKRLLGLMYVKNLEGGECMLFIFSYPARHGIWMRNMFFSIDVLWADSSGTIIDYVSNARPCKSFRCRVFTPSSDAKYIIEAKHGFIREYGLKVGNKIKVY